MRNTIATRDSRELLLRAGTGSPLVARAIAERELIAAYPELEEGL